MGEAEDMEFLFNSLFVNVVLILLFPKYTFPVCRNIADAKLLCF